MFPFLFVFFPRNTNISKLECLFAPQLLQLVVHFQRRRPIAVCVLYPPALSVSIPPAGCRLLTPLDGHALCPIRSGVGRQPAPCLALGLQQARWLGLRQARCGVVAVVYILLCGRCSQVAGVRVEARSA